MESIRVEREIAGRKLSIETGKLAKQADGSVTVQYGETIVLATVVAEDKEITDVDFFPLTVDYREKTYAAGKIPGGFIKREGKPSNKEILTMRMIDRPIRPLFPKGYFDEVQIMTMVLSADPDNEPDILALIGASAALSISHVPFEGPIGGVRIGKINDEIIINPTYSQLELSEIDLVVAGTKEAVNMIELGSKPTDEATVLEAIKHGFEIVKQICDMINELTEKVNPTKKQPPALPSEYDILKEKIEQKYADEIYRCKQIPAKLERNSAVEKIKEKAIEELITKEEEDFDLKVRLAKLAFEEVEKEITRRLIIEGKRVDGRSYDDLRPISCEVGLLPRTHGSALFTRGETQALVTVTLGTSEDEQIIDGLTEEYSKKFMLDYNFPPFSVGEVGIIRGPGRREIGHGALAEKALAQVMPPVEEFPYTVRVVSDILESNGSSSMATVCGASLALMDAGVPITSAVAGISIGMVSLPDKTIYLTDIVGDEDHFGDMDFKIAGTEEGITAIQLDLKIKGISFEQIEESFKKAKQARLKILEIMNKTISKPRSSISPYAPRIVSVKISPDKIGTLIGPAGKTIKKLQEDTNTTIWIEPDGVVYISASNLENAEKAKKEVEKLTEEVEIGKIYEGKVKAIRDFGAFIEILPGTEGLCHISELSDGYVANVADVCKVGDTVKVKVISIDELGRIQLSIKAVQAEESRIPKSESGKKQPQGHIKSQEQIKKSSVATHQHQRRRKPGLD